MAKEKPTKKASEGINSKLQLVIKSGACAAPSAVCAQRRASRHARAQRPQAPRQLAQTPFGAARSALETRARASE